MSLAKNYATVLSEVTVESLIEYMKKKGHLSLLPQVVRILERTQDDRTLVTVANKKSATALRARFPDAKIILDPRIVGGHLVRQGARITDATYRRALVEIYKRVTK